MPSQYTTNAKAAGLDIITRTLSGQDTEPMAVAFTLREAPVIDKSGRHIEVLDVLAREVGVLGVFSGLAWYCDLFCELFGTQVICSPAIGASAGSDGWETISHTYIVKLSDNDFSSLLVSPSMQFLSCLQQPGTTPSDLMTQGRQDEGFAVKREPASSHIFA